MSSVNKVADHIAAHLDDHIAKFPSLCEHLTLSTAFGCSNSERLDIAVPSRMIT